MVFHLAFVWITIAISLSLVCTTECAAADDYELLRQYLQDEISKTTSDAPNKKVDNLIRILVNINNDVEEAFKDDTQSMAAFLRSKNYDALDKYIRIAVEPSNFEETITPNAFQDLDDPEIEQAALEILRKEKDKEHMDLPRRSLSSFFLQFPQDAAIGIIKRFLKISQKGSPVTLVNTPKITNPVLLSAQLSFDVIDNMYKWWMEDISGERCARNIIRNTGVTMGGVSGAGTGIYLGNLFFGPPGAAVGALGGAFLGSMAADKLMDHLIQKIFDLPKSEAEEKAYRFFGLQSRATINEINDAFRRKANAFHPQNRISGDKEKYFETKVQMQILRMAKS